MMLLRKLANKMPISLGMGRINSNNRAKLDRMRMFGVAMMTPGAVAAVGLEVEVEGTAAPAEMGEAGMEEIGAISTSFERNRLTGRLCCI